MDDRMLSVDDVDRERLGFSSDIVSDAVGLSERENDADATLEGVLVVLLVAVSDVLWPSCEGELEFDEDSVTEDS